MIRIFIVTYKCPFLNDNLKSLFESDADSNDYTVDIIVNHPDYYIADEYRDRVTIHLQSLRSETSEGFLSRDWNQALVLGFGSLKNPRANQVILCQDDTIWNKDWKTCLDKIHESYTFYACGEGDAFMSFISNAIRRVGLFDERFCGMGCHEADYFLRQFIHNKKYASINDFHHGRVWNPTMDVVKRVVIDDVNEDYRSKKPRANLFYHKSLWQEKWSKVTEEKHWGDNFSKIQSIEDLSPDLPYVIFYPHFERDLSPKIHNMVERIKERKEYFKNLKKEKKQKKRYKTHD